MSKEFAGIVQNAKKLDQVLAKPAGGSDFLDGLVPNSYPATVAGLTLTSATSLGAWTEIIPASTITVDFAIAGVTFALIDTLSASYILEAAVGAAAAEVLVARVKWANANQASRDWLPFAKPFRVAANTRVAMRMATTDATPTNLVHFAVLYYPLA